MCRSPSRSCSRHPWPCLLFLLPLLAAYELGVHRLSGGQPDALRNGADSWLRQGFAALGLSDEERLRRQFPMYDALYAYAQQHAG